MNKKKIILTLALAFCLVLALGAGNANAGPAQYYFDTFNNVMAEVTQLGMFGPSEWAILVKVDLSGSPPDVGIGFSLYHPQYGDLHLHICKDPGWLSHSYEGVWAGSGSDFVLSTSALYRQVHPLTTMPPTATALSSSADPAAQ
jgi:hypothetical protein